MEKQGSIHQLQQDPLSKWGESKCVHSDLTFFEKDDAATPLSIKWVLEGTESYRINGKRHLVHENQFLIVNAGDAVETTIKAQNRTRGICIYPPVDMAVDALTQSEIGPAEQLEQAKSKGGPVRFTSKSEDLRTGQNVALYLLQKRTELLSTEDKTSEWWETFYMELLSCMHQDQQKLEQKLDRIPSTKKHTKEELYRRLALAKDFIHDHRFETIDVDSLSRVSALSKFHFLRNFKAFYGCSPYQLSLRLKLEEARVLLQNNYSYQAVADMVGYSDGKNLRKALLKSAARPVTG